MMNLQSNIQKGSFSMTDSEIIEIIRAYALLKQQYERQEEEWLEILNDTHKQISRIKASYRTKIGKLESKIKRLERMLDVKHRRNKQIKKRK